MRRKLHSGKARTFNGALTPLYGADIKRRYHLGIAPRTGKAVKPPMSDEQTMTFAALEDGELARAVDIAGACGRDPGAVRTSLYALEARGLVKRVGSKWIKTTGGSDDDG